MDDSHIIYSGSLTSCGFDEPGEHGMCVGVVDEEADNKKDAIKCQFVKVDDIQFVEKNIDISNIGSVVEAIEKLELKEDIYKVKIVGTRNLDISSLIDSIKLTGKNICEIEDDTHLAYDLEKIAKQNNLIGIFVKKMLKKLEEEPENEETIIGAIEYVLNNL